MKNQFAMDCLVLMLLVSIVAGCGAPAAPTKAPVAPTAVPPAGPADPTVTVSDGKCIYAGPTTIKPKFNLVMDIRDPSAPPMYAFHMVIVREGATLDDLKSVTQWNSVDPKPGIYGVRMAGAMQTGITKQDLDLTISARYQGEPIYIVCVDHSKNVFGVLGPINVESE